MQVPPAAAVANRFFKLLLAESRNLNRRIVEGRILGVEQHEETLTESLLLELRRKSPNVRVRTYSRVEESRHTGADWAWWWEGEERWFGALVQAKRLDTRSGRYNFGYTPRPWRRNPSPQRQIDLLMDAARDLQLPPLYVLFNGPEFDMDPSQWTCDEIPFDLAAMGAAILPGAVAAWLVGLNATDQATVGGLARPLPCHICPQRCSSFAALDGYLRSPISAAKELLGFPEDTKETDLAFRAASSYLAGLANARVRQLRVLPMSPELSVVRQGVREVPPDYVLGFVDGDRQRLDDDDRVPERVVVMQQPD